MPKGARRRLVNNRRRRMNNPMAGGDSGLPQYQVTVTAQRTIIIECEVHVHAANPTAAFNAIADIVERAVADGDLNTKFNWSEVRDTGYGKFGYQVSECLAKPL